jgi:inorganic phosphate transporter, PiT family
LSFDFTNGFHDTANAMATSIATKALGPRTAVGLSAVLNLVGAFLSLSVAATIASGLVNTGLVTLTVVFAGLAGAIVWNLITWLFGIPSSSSHALIAGVIGSASLVSLAHGTNDAQKTMGIITLALITNGTLAAGATTPLWVIVLCTQDEGEPEERDRRVGRRRSPDQARLDAQLPGPPARRPASPDNPLPAQSRRAHDDQQPDIQQ